MHRRIGTRHRAVAMILAVLAAAMLGACGSSSSSGNAQTLLAQTFSGSHKVQSGVLSFSVNVDPSGSSTFKGPISLSLSGPFQSRGAGKLPESNFSLDISALGHHGALGVVSTGTNGYVTLQGQAYQLPAADFQRLASSFSGASGGATGGLSKLGIDPRHWLTNPSVVGNETVAGASTTHIRAGVDVSALLGDLSTVLQRASSSGGAASSRLPTTISPATRARIAAAVKHATVDVWTGTGDKTLRKLSINLNVPVTGQVSTLLGGMSSAGIGLSFQYANLNQPQTITAPTSVAPFADFATKLRTVLAQLRSTLGGAGLGSPGSGSTGSGSGSTGSGSGSTGSSSGSSGASGVNRYSQCIQQATGDVTKMQKCGSLLSGGR